jgi:hypothetical protein
VLRLIADLDSRQFALREQATQRLLRVGRRALPALRRELLGTSSPEARQRLKALVAELETRGVPTDNVRAARAIRLLELIGTDAACGLLRTLAGGEPTADQTRFARAALERVQQHRDGD